MTTCECQCAPITSHLEGCNNEYQKTLKDFDERFVIKIGLLAEKYPILLTELLKCRLEALDKYGNVDFDQVPKHVFVLYTNDY